MKIRLQLAFKMVNIMKLLLEVPWRFRVDVIITKLNNERKGEMEKG